MASASEILSEHRIVLKRITNGNHRTTCPKCSPGRTKKRDPCLSVSIDNRGVQFNCWHCGWGGGAFFDAAIVGRGGGMGERPKSQPTDLGSSRRRLRYGVLP